MTVITGKARIGQMQALNVRDFGAKGDNTADDTVPIQNAVNALAGVSSARGIIFFPAGTYLVTAPISLLWVDGTGGVDSSIILRGAGHASKVGGNLPGGYIFDRGNTTMTGYGGVGTFCIEEMYISNSGNTSTCGCIRIASGRVFINACRIGTVVGNCVVLNNGLDGGGNPIQCAGGIVQDCILSSGGKSTNSGQAAGVGLALSANCYSFGNDITGQNVGTRVFGPGISIFGGRHETCNIAVQTNQDIVGNQHPTGTIGFTCIGQSWENNDITWDFRNGLIAAKLGDHQLIASDGKSKNGVIFPSDASASQILIEDLTVTGGWVPGYGIECPGSGSQSFYRTFRNVTVGSSNARTWQMPTGAYVAKWDQCNNPDPVFTFANLPGGGAQVRNQGDEYMISDSSLAPVGNFGATVAGGGANTAKVRWNGSNWVIC